MASTVNKNAVSEKHNIIAKANSNIFVVVAISVFVVISCIFATRALVSQSFYNGRVIEEKEKALTVLENNLDEVEDLQSAYVAFISEPINVLGGNPVGTGPKDGDNAKITLDSLPSEYDYPALASSIEKIIVDGGYQIDAIGGKEDPNLANTSTSASAVVTSDPIPTEIPYPFAVNADPVSGLELIRTLELSIRPFYISNLQISGGEGSIKLNIDLKTFYQPSTGVTITTKEVK